MQPKVWTEGRLKSFITSLLRGGFRRYPTKYEVLNEAFVGKKINIKTQRTSKHFKCALCKKDFPTKEVQVDHISPVVDPVIGFIGWDSFIERLFCPKENLQVLCLECHTKKTLEEKQLRTKLLKQYSRKKSK